MVKYFSADILDIIKFGSFRFGLLYDYKNKESQHGAASRFSDKAEGSVETYLSGFAAGEISHPIFGGKAFGTFGANGVTFSENFRAFVFCASAGDYSREHHKMMKNGVPRKGYAANPELTNYAVLDVEKFVSALSSFHPNNRQVCDCGMVQYGAKNYEDHITGSGYQFDLQKAQYRAVFVKPDRFSVEREIRFVIPPRTGLFGDETKGALFLKSGALRDSIVRIGVFDETQNV